jgi:hypothetical protein
MSGQASIGGLPCASTTFSPPLPLFSFSLSHHLLAHLSMKLARPDFEKRDLERAQRQAIIASYPTELALWVKLGEANLDRLRSARTWIPG